MTTKVLVTTLSLNHVKEGAYRYPRYGDPVIIVIDFERREDAELAASAINRGSALAGFSRNATVLA